MTESREYWQSFISAAVKDAMKNGSGASYAADAQEVARNLRRDEAVKARILAHSPHLAYAIDAAELAGMSARELASRELKELGIEPGDNDPVALLDAHHAGREAARRQAWGSAHDGHWRSYSGQAWDGSEEGGDDLVSRYIRGER